MAKAGGSRSSASGPRNEVKAEGPKPYTLAVPVGERGRTMPGRSYGRFSIPSPGQRGRGLPSRPVPGGGIKAKVTKRTPKVTAKVTGRRK